MVVVCVFIGEIFVILCRFSEKFVVGWVWLNVLLILLYWLLCVMVFGILVI